MRSFPLFFKQFLKHPFETLDNLDLQYFGFQFNILKDDVKLRKALFDIFFLIPLILWVLLGADSTADQLVNFLLNIPNFLLGNITFNGLTKIYDSYYGLGTHWSAAVIYSLLFIGISKHLRDELEAKNSENLALTTGFVAFTIGTFEYFWQVSYFIFQNQPWILRFQFPQARIILQNTLFLLTGAIVLLGFNWKEYKLNIDKRTITFFLATVSLILLWWMCPFETTPLTVGSWTSSSHFPQTMYTVAPSSQVAYGIMYHVENPGVHLVNNLTKIFMTFAFYSLFRIRRRKKVG